MKVSQNWLKNLVEIKIILIFLLSY